MTSRLVGRPVRSSGTLKRGLFILAVSLMLGFAAFATVDLPSSSDNDSGDDLAIVAVSAPVRHRFAPRIVSPSLAHHPGTIVHTPDAPNHLALRGIPSKMGRELLQLFALQRK